VPRPLARIASTASSGGEAERRLDGLRGPHRIVLAQALVRKEARLGVDDDEDAVLAANERH
jgi:hypothetical protein